MKQLAWFLLLIHLIILILWVANSGYLFSILGVIIWIATIVFGVVASKQIKERNIVKKLIMISSFFMLFLVVVTIAIFFTTNSMP